MKVGELLLYHVENKIIGLLQKKFFKEEIETLQEDEWKNPTSLEIKNQLKFNSYRLDSFLDYSGILKSGSLSRKLKHKIEASYHSSKNVSCNKCTDLSFSCENSTPRNRYATNEWILDIGCSSAVSSHLTRCKSFRVKRWQVQGLIQK